MRDETIPREPSMQEVLLDAVCRDLLAGGMSRAELAARIKDALDQREQYEVWRRDRA